MEAKITYFETPGKQNTDAVMEIVKKRAQELGIKTVVIASYRGYTADKAVRALDGLRIIIVAGFFEPSTKNLSQTFTQGDEKFIRSKATVLIATHLFSGVSQAVLKKFNSSSPGKIISSALQMVGVGIKVGIECTVMAADAGLVSTNEDIIAVAGTRSGADTAIVVRPVNSQDLFELRVKQILCKPAENHPKAEVPRDFSLQAAVARMTKEAKADDRTNLVMTPAQWKKLVLSHKKSSQFNDFSKEIVNRVGEVNSKEEINKWQGLATNIWNNTPQHDRGGK
jgi:hypothetical protein